MHGVGTTGSAETSRPSLREWLTGLYVISPGTGSLAPVTRNARHERRKLDTSTGMSGPHDFTVRADRARLAQPSRPSQPALAYRDDAYAPLHEAGCGKVSTVSENKKVKYFGGRWTRLLAFEDTHKICCLAHRSKYLFVVCTRLRRRNRAADLPDVSDRPQSVGSKASAEAHREGESVPTLRVTLLVHRY